ncbi:MAG: tetratricopeptide repeat protein [Rhodospirillaceae bacterium]|nr:tetratricopeptide repeat protein [Rhodospirillaceae bacterium]
MVNFRPRIILVAVSSLFWAAVIALPGQGHAAAIPGPGASPVKQKVFEMPRYALQQRKLTKAVIGLFRAHRFSEAETFLRQPVAQFPDAPVHHYNLAAALARQNKQTAALESLNKAIDHGFTSKAALTQDPDLAPIRELPGFQKLLSKLAQMSATAIAPAEIKPRVVTKAKALVDAGNTTWAPASQSLLSMFAFNELHRPHKAHGGDGDIAWQLNRWSRKGEAAGNFGDLYDNRDSSHSHLSRKLFPQLAHIEYSADAKAAGIHYGVNSQILHNAITFGNSSTAITSGPLWRSQSRLILTTPELIARAYQQYANNHLYIFPEVRDHDPERGDLFPANTPYIITSQGKSGSDRPFLRAVAVILASLKPDVKNFLRAHRLISPTVQMIFRTGQKFVQTDTDYLAATAHPSVFDAVNINLEKMMNLAHALDKEDVPPPARITVTEETKAQPGIDYFGPSSTDEILFTTPNAIARMVKSTVYERRMVISAAKTLDPNGRPLTFTWRLMRGDKDRVTVKPLAEDGSVVELRIPWHQGHSGDQSRKVPGRSDLSTNRVEFAVFANNGVHYGAPAFVSLYYPPKQVRKYDQQGRIQEIDYAPRALKDVYADPVLFPRRGWRDRYLYTKDGRLIGWDRIVKKAIRRFTRHGVRALETDASGRPVKAERIAYGVKLGKGQIKQIIEVPFGKAVIYDYISATDQLGIPKNAP